MEGPKPPLLLLLLLHVAWGLSGTTCLTPAHASPAAPPLLRRCRAEPVCAALLPFWGLQELQAERQRLVDTLEALGAQVGA